MRIVVGFPGGSASDTTARLIGQSLSERLGQPFVIENRTGAGGNIGTESVVRAPPDGYTLLVIAWSVAINPTLYDNLNFDFIRDIAPVAGVFRGPYVMVVNPSVPTTTVPELIAYAKANPRKLNMASPGTGTGPHIAGELFKPRSTVFSKVHLSPQPVVNRLHYSIRSAYRPRLSDSVRLGDTRLDCEASRLLAPLPNPPHLKIGRLGVVSEAVDVEQRMRQPVRGQSVAISFEK